MAARPNSLRALTYGLQLAEKHLQRLDSMVEMTTRAVEENLLLSAVDVANYKACLRAAKKQRTQFSKVLDIELPPVNTTTPRKVRGRPSQGELDALAASRARKPPRKPRAKATAAAPAVEATAPKKLGRPKGSKNKPKTNGVAVAPIAAEVPAPKKRGRPKGSKNKPKTNGVAAAPVTEATAPKKRGRPKGSKNKPKANAATAA